MCCKCESTERKPFDVEAAMRGEPVVTRDGRKVLEVHVWKHLPGPGVYPISAMVEGEDQHHTFTKEGVYCRGEESGKDLFMTTPNPNKRYALFNRRDQTILDRYNQSWEGAVYTDKAEAEREKHKFPAPQVIEIVEFIVSS